VKQNASKWLCPTGECQPKSKWVKASRLPSFAIFRVDRVIVVQHPKPQTA
jgi:hypothetical protein